MSFKILTFNSEGKSEMHFTNKILKNLLPSLLLNIFVSQCKLWRKGVNSLGLSQNSFSCKLWRLLWNIR